jgi:hypothetical protein
MYHSAAAIARLHGDPRNSASLTLIFAAPARRNIG